ncbi:unnamed protein product [Linum tenue]|uniref:Peptidase A1 domain-containing protein n=1 Tax=Linum tenue TaxID=586396 RepID=A0AAV0M5F7_9ROSI|nr:unnamed protein product [Linum tenue]
MATSTFLFLSLLLCSAAVDHCSPSTDDPTRISVIPIYSKCSPISPPPPPSSSPFDTINRLAANDHARLASLADDDVPIAAGQKLFNVGNYVVRVSLGNPNQTFAMVLDISNDVTFVPCSGCSGNCSAANPTAAFFSPNASGSYWSVDCPSDLCSLLPNGGRTCAAGKCRYKQSYGGDSRFAANLGTDWLAIGGRYIPGFAFGCVGSVSGGSVPAQGLLGFGRGPLSFLGQTEPAYSGVFSYCLPSFTSSSFSGSLRLGPKDQPGFTSTTPLLRNPRRPSLYYVNLTGVSVGPVKVPIRSDSLAFDPRNGAGTIIDSGTVITRFVGPVYAAIRKAFRKQVKGPFSRLGAFDTCFPANGQEAEAPSFAFHFEGLDLMLAVENTLIHSSGRPLACLSMAAAPNNVNSVLNVIANLQQENLRILFDVKNSVVGFAGEVCN